MQALSIIGGRYKGKRLLLPPLEITRSTKSIVRGSVFDRFQVEIRDSVFVELFGGSGSMGLEALSRGACAAIFCEKNSTSFKVLKENAKEIDPSSSHLFFGDSFALIGEIVKKAESFNAPVIYYLDPPFDIRDGMEEIYRKTEELIPKLASKKTLSVVIEHSSKRLFAENIQNMELVKRKKFGNTTLSYYKSSEFR